MTKKDHTHSITLEPARGQASEAERRALAKLLASIIKRAPAKRGIHKKAS